MNYGKIAICFLLITAITFPSFAASRKAKVTTETGKKWDVLFLKMANDTVYVKAFKPNGDMFNISGHKSKFKKVEFPDGSLLDFKLSNYTLQEGAGHPPKAPEALSQPSKGSAKRAPRDTFSLAKSPSSSQKYWNDTFEVPNVYEEEAPAAPGGSSFQSRLGAKSETTDHQTMAIDTSAKRQKKDKAPAKPKVDLTAKAPVASPPPVAVVAPEKPKPSIAEAAPEKPIPSIAEATPEKSTPSIAEVTPEKPIPPIAAVTPEKPMRSKAEGKPKKPNPPVVAVGQKGGSGFGLSLFGLSMTSFACSGVLYYFYHKDHVKEEESFGSLNNSVIKGENTLDLISRNKSQHQELQRKLTLSQALLGVGAAFLTADIVFYF